MRSSLGLIRLRHFFVCFATLKITDKNGSQICFKLMRLFFFLLVETLSEFDCGFCLLCFCRNINTYKSCGYVNTYIYLVIFVSLGLRPQVLDIHVTTGGRPSAKPKNTKTTCLLTQNYLQKISRFGFKNQPGVKQIQIALLVETLCGFERDCCLICFCRNVNTYMYIYIYINAVATFTHAYT